MGKRRATHSPRTATLVAAALTAGTIGLGVVAAAPAVAGPASFDQELAYAKEIVLSDRSSTMYPDGKLDEATISAWLQLGYAICRLDQVKPSDLNHSHVVVRAAETHLCASMPVTAPAPVADIKSQLNASLQNSTIQLDQKLLDGWHTDDYYDHDH